ncbi:wall-associated receptor kinase 2-like protein [Tanacetum coccineum]
MTDMKFVVLIWAVFQRFSFTTSDTNSLTESHTLINSTNLAKPGCDSRCGDLIVPYPFGVGDNSDCYINEGFRIYCDTSINPPKASIGKSHYNSIKLVSDSTIRVSSIVASRCYSQDGTIYNGLRAFMNYTNFPYTFSNVNKYTVIGCYDSGWLTAVRKSRNVSTGCMVFCSTPEQVVSDECTGNGCCQSSIPKDLISYSTRVRSLQDSEDDVSYIRSFDPCTYAFVGEENVFKFNGLTDLKNDTSFKKRIEATVPVVLEWAIGNLNCSEAEARDGVACQSNSECVSSTRESGGYRCVCKQGYEGNPYLSPGCQDINECDRMKDFPCYGTCINTPGNYTCKCKEGYSGDGKIRNDCRRKPFKVLGLSIGMGIGFVAILTGLSVLYLMAKKRKIAKLREKFYEQNGGAFLEEKLKTNGGTGVGFVNVFQFEELKEATNNYAEDRILGRGGNGIVYKGTLPDKRVVAIKKSQKLDKEQREQFINEMVILTQINHTNVPFKDSHMKQQVSLALSSTDARMANIHRECEVYNILLRWTNYTAKIADFGASRLVPLGHDQVVTLVQGTFGYLDPEYFHTGELTDKSDVYSFGVVLAKKLFLTGQTTLNMERDP